MLNKIAVLLSLILMTCGVGCVALSHYITPADVNPNAVKYVTDAGVAEPNDYKAWYPNLYLAEKLVTDLDHAYQQNQFAIQKAAEKNNLDYTMYRESANTNYNAAVEREEALFGSNGLLSMGLGMIGMGGFTGILGLMRKRPGDITKEEAVKAVAEATGVKEAEINAKLNQLTQVVQGIELFKDTVKKTEDATIAGKADIIINLLKNCCVAKQDTDTAVAVAQIKASV